MYEIQLKNLAAMLSDNHSEITNLMCNKPDPVESPTSYANRMEEVAKRMEMQSARLLSAADEVREIKRKS